MRVFRNAALAPVAALFLFSLQPARAADSPALGGPDGEPFRAECPAGQFLTGLEVKAGRLIEAITPQCAPFDGKSRLETPTALSAIGGDSRAKSRKANCAPNTYASGLKIARTDNLKVSAIELTCRDIATAGVAETTCVTQIGKCVGRPTDCADAEAAIGVHGRAGKTIDALGLICGPRPGMTKPAEPVAAATPEPDPIKDAETKAAAEAKAKAEEQARTEAEAKRAAEEADRQRAETEARAKAEAEEAARRQAEELARAVDDARARAELPAASGEGAPASEAPAPSPPSEPVVAAPEPVAEDADPTGGSPPPPVAEEAPIVGAPAPEAEVSEPAVESPPPEVVVGSPPPPESSAPAAEMDVDDVLERMAPAAGSPAPETAPPPAAAVAPAAPPPAAAVAPPPPPPPPARESAVAAPATPSATRTFRKAAKKTAAEAPVSESSPDASTPPDADGKWRLVPVYFGTDRKPLEGVQRLSYGHERARKLEVGRALVSVPTAHQVPNVERPWALTIPGTSIVLYEEAEDPAKHFTMREIKAMSQDDLVKLVKERLKGSKTYKDQALIFIHGYNTSFDNAVYRTAQIAHDLEFDGAPFLYSWPSRGELSGYTYDRASNQQAEPFMREFVDMVVKKSGAKSVSVIAHSMGNELTLQVLQKLKTANVKINQIILAAPDVDRDAFENIANELKGLSKGITLYAAANDKALLASQRFHGGVPRAGDVPATGPVVVEGVDTIDVTTLSTDSLGLNHSTYAERTALIDDIARLLKTGLRPPVKRTPALAPVMKGTLQYWKYPAP